MLIKQTVLCVCCVSFSYIMVWMTDKLAALEKKKEEEASHKSSQGFPDPRQVHKSPPPPSPPSLSLSPALFLSLLSSLILSISVSILTSCPFLLRYQTLFYKYFIWFLLFSWKKIILWFCVLQDITTKYLGYCGAQYCVVIVVTSLFCMKIM